MKSRLARPLRNGWRDPKGAEGIRASEGRSAKRDSRMAINRERATEVIALFSFDRSESVERLSTLPRGSGRPFFKLCACSAVIYAK